MSRYSIPAHDPTHSVLVGWDDPLTTFFAQVEDSTINDEEEALLLWIGDRNLAIPTINRLQFQLAPYATIPNDILEQLQADSDQPWTPSPLQQLVRRMFTT